MFSLIRRCVCSADVEVVCLNSRPGYLGCIGCCQVFSKVLIVRENIDIGWAMMGSENHVPPSEDLRPYVEKVVDALTELHGKEQAMAFKMLGYPAGDQVPPTGTGSLMNLDHLEIPQLEQIVGSQFQLQLDWTHLEISPDAVSGERERRLLSEHIRHPMSVVLEECSNMWYRKTPEHLQLRLGPAAVSLYSPVRRLNFEQGGDDYGHDIVHTLENASALPENKEMYQILGRGGDEGGDSDRDGAPVQDVTGTDVMHGRVSKVFVTSSR
jgi:hypothetical protein